MLQHAGWLPSHFKLMFALVSFSPAKPSDGSSSREDISSQLFRRNEQIRKLEVKLSGMFSIVTWC